MALAAVIEVEEGALVCTVATVTGREIVVSACQRLPLQEFTAANLAGSLRALQAQIGRLQQVHFLLGDRRICHYIARVPQLDQRELMAFVQRESLRQAGLPTGTELAGHARLSRRVENGMRRIGVVAVPQALLEPIERGCADADVELLGVHSIESCIGGVLDRTLPERTAVVDYSGGKARFLVYEGGQLAQMRRFVVHGIVSDAGSQALLVGQLAMELPRTLEFLREQGCEPPTCLLVSHHIAAGDDLLAMTEGAITSVRQYVPAIQVADGEDMPSLATVGLLQSLQRRRPLPTLARGFSIRLPRRPLLTALRGAAMVAMALGGIWAGKDQLGIHGLAGELAACVHEREELERSLAVQSSPSPLAETLDAEQQREQEILGQRRPISMLLARLSRPVREHVFVDGVEFVDADHVRIEGNVAAPDRLTALREIGDFGDVLSTIPYLARIGAEDIKDDPARPGHMRFKFDLTWRRP